MVMAVRNAEESRVAVLQAVNRIFAMMDGRGIDVAEVEAVQKGQADEGKRE